MMDPVEDQLLAIVQREFGLERQALTKATLLADLGDSLDQVTLLSALEEAFDITIESEQSSSLATVGDVLRLLKEPVHG